LYNKCDIEKLLHNITHFVKKIENNLYVSFVVQSVNKCCTAKITQTRGGHGPGGRFSAHFGLTSHPYGWGKTAPSTVILRGNPEGAGLCGAGTYKFVRWGGLSENGSFVIKSVTTYYRLHSTLYILQLNPTLEKNKAIIFGII
jgi:hypothetical protein